MMATRLLPAVELDPERYATGAVAEAARTIDCPDCGAVEGMSCVHGSADDLRESPTHAARAEAWWAREEAHR